MIKCDDCGRLFDLEELVHTDEKQWEQVLCLTCYEEYAKEKQDEAE